MIRIAAALMCAVSLVMPALAQERFHYVVPSDQMRGVNNPPTFIFSMQAESDKPDQPKLQIDVICEEGGTGIVRITKRGAWPAAAGTATLTFVTVDSFHKLSVREASTEFGETNAWSTLEFSPSQKLSPLIFGATGILTLRVEADSFDQEYLILPMFDKYADGERIGGHFVCTDNKP